MIEVPTFGRAVTLVTVGLVLLSIGYLAVGRAQLRADTMIDPRCSERTVDGGLFEAEHRGVPALVCATDTILPPTLRPGATTSSTAVATQ
jgi:hypothetical protein